VPEWLPTPDNLQYNGAVHRLNTLVYELINVRREQHAVRPVEGLTSCDDAAPRDLLDSLLLARDHDGSCLEDEEVRDGLMTLLFAGQETTAIMLGWLSADLAWHREAQERAAAEVAVRPLCPPILRRPSPPAHLCLQVCNCTHEAALSLTRGWAVGCDPWQRVTAQRDRRCRTFFRAGSHAWKT
jgi:cytochrome P450